MEENNPPPPIELAKQILDPTSCDELNYREFCADAAPELAQALLDCGARCEALEAALAKCETFIWNDFDLDDEGMATELQIARDVTEQALTSNPTHPALDKDARIAELENAGQALLKAREYKMLMGKDESYEKAKTEAWAMLSAALAPRSADGKGE